jgi:hypothetical protein
MRLGRSHKGLRQLYEDDNAKGVPAAIAGKLRKFLLALETAETLDQVGSVSRMETTPVERRTRGILEPDCNRKLATDFPLWPGNEHRHRH